jgi:DNA-binding PadR family transcriptional regulator
MRHHEDNWGRNWRRMEAMARRGARRFGNFDMNMNIGPGEFGGFGGNFRIGRMLASGDLRLVALYLIEQQPRHGYDLIKAIEEKSQGFYSPSPGIVYPALTFLEEAGYVTSAVEGNKKLYTITEEGRAHLNDNREAIESTLEFLGNVGTRMNNWRERMASPDFPFTPEQAEKLRSMGRKVGDWFEHAGEPGGPGEPHPGHEHHGHEHHGHFGHEQGTPDRDIADVGPEVNEARKALKKAIKAALKRGPEQEARVSDILRRAAEDIRSGLADDEADIDI